MLSDDITTLAGKIASVPEDDWNVSARALGYPVQSTELEGLSIAFSRQDTGAFTAIQDRAGNVVNILPADDQAAYAAHAFTQGARTTVPYTYQQALNAELSGIGQAGAALGHAAASPLAGLASGLTTGPVILLIVAALALIFLVKK